MDTARLGLDEELRLENVSYRYPHSDGAGISDISISIRAGEKTGIVGSSGAGKTTLADVVIGLLRPTEGVLFADGIAITETNLRNWQQTVGYVPQDIFLTDASIAENVALGTPPESIDRERVRDVARIAQIDQFIMEELPQAYDTHVGERGVRLSGGQRQRIGIARALYYDADLIVLDEATSALDNLTEREVMTAIDGLPKGKTVIIIAHRLSTVHKCDRIIVLREGSMCGYGNWHQLVEENVELKKIAPS
jgi:ABC-type multidrug transport system fused ATPase/permease subunit